jgi:preprotein translocase subunit SecB
MAKNKDNKEAAAAPAANTPAGAQTAPTIQVISQYVKDCSFENPHAPESLISGWPAPETHVQVSLAQRQVNENLFESALNFRIEAKNVKDNKMAFIIDLHYGALIGIQNIPQENIPPVLAVEVPKLLFPFVREIVASMTIKGGYPPLYLTPINFEALYVTEMKRLQEASKNKAGAA